jgi:serine/threonine-protein kinase RsbT
VTEGPIDDMKVRVLVRDDTDVVVVRRMTRELALQEGFSETSIEALATATTEIARNIVCHAMTGEVLLGVTTQSGKRGVVVIARDDGPGISDLDRAMEDGYSSGDGLGLGLPSARRLVDEFELVSQQGNGTTITMRKWTSVEIRP